MDAQQQAQLEQGNAAKQAQTQPALTPEQMKQQQEMQAAMQQQQQQLQAHINQQVQLGVTTYNLDVQRLTIAAQGLEACVNARKDEDAKGMADEIARRIRDLVIPLKPLAQNVSCETTKELDKTDQVNA